MIIATSAFCRLSYFVLGLLLLLLAGDNAEAQSQADLVLSRIPEPYRANYADLLRAPNDVRAMFEAAQRFERDGLYPEALRLYERMLLLEADLPAARLSAALVNLRIDNPSAALAHLNRLHPGTLSPAEARTARLLREEATRSVRQHRVEGRLQAGLRYNTNANAAPLEFGEELPDEAELISSRESDFAAFADLAALHIFDPHRQDALTFDSSLRLVGRKQFELGEFDTVYAMITTGPRFRADAGRPYRLTFRPYLSGEVYALGGEIFSAAPGLGVELRDRFSPRLDTSLDIAIEYNFYGSAAEIEPTSFFGNPDAEFPARSREDLEGYTARGEAFLAWSLTPALTMVATPSIGYRDADDDSFSRNEYGIRLSATIAFDLLPDLSDRPALATLYGSYRRFDYNGLATPYVFFLDEDREDHLWEAGGTAELPFGERLSAVADIRYSRTRSNVEVFEWEDVQTSLGISYRF